MRDETPPARPRAREALLALLIVLAGAWLRGRELDETELWVDEAESCLNGLTILERGLPYGEALGLPVYENTLVEPWPESAEYEFRDSSYSASGLAVYHGWLPLYAIAASYALAGVRADPPGGLEVRHDEREMRRRTVFGRLPAVLFGVATLVVFFLAGRELYGRDLAFAALLAGAVAKPAVLLSRQARYYSATVFASSLAVLAIALVARRGRARDWALAAVAYVLLFHVHVLTFAVGCVALALVLPRALRIPGAPRRAAVAAAAVLAGTLPWVLATGFLDQAQGVPKGITLLELPEDLWTYPRSKLPFLAIAVPGLVGLLVARFAPRGRSPQFLGAWTAERGLGLVLAAWIAIAWVAFTCLAPAASLFLQRTTVPLAGPAILFGSLTICAFARTLDLPSSPVVGPALSLALAVALGGPSWSGLLSTGDHAPVRAIVEALREEGPFERGTRFYATPNDQLPLSLYTGIPFQSVAPVRKSFLDSYEGPLVLAETLARYEPLGVRRMIELARDHGEELDAEQAVDLRKAMSVELARRDVAALAGRVDAPEHALPSWIEPALAEQRAENPAAIRRKKDPVEDNPAMFRGFEIRTWLDWWPVFFYRFVDPASRSGANLNYAERIRGARARVLRTSHVLWFAGRLQEAPKAAGN